MPYTQDLIEEMNVLIRYNLANGRKAYKCTNRPIRPSSPPSRACTAKAC